MSDKGDIAAVLLHLCRGKLQFVQAFRIDGQGQVIYPGISETLIMLGFDAVEQEDPVRIVGKIFFQFFLQRAVVAPCQVGNLMCMAQRCDQWEEVNAHDGIVGIGLQLLLKAVTEKIVMEFIGEVIIYRFTGMTKLLQIIQRILIRVTSHIVK